MIDTRLTKAAYEFAADAHADQVRKFCGSPYITHPKAVAELVSLVEDHTEQMIAAAYLHDVVEDTDYTITDIASRFGMKVAELVLGLTNVSKPEDGNRATRKLIDRNRLAETSYEVQTIKYADLIHNASSFIIQNDSFSKLWMKEKDELLSVMTKGDIRLFDIALMLKIEDK